MTLQKLQHKMQTYSFLGKGSITRATEIVCEGEGGGGTPLSVNFFLLKICLKTVFFGQKMLFLAENLSNSVRYGGGGYPPIPLIFFR